jgi:hypothetical protein
MAGAEGRRHTDMGYDGPSDSAVGMQTYPENTPDTLLLGGEVLVLDQSQRCTCRMLARSQRAVVVKQWMRSS